MNKVILLFTAALLFGSSAAIYAQSEVDAYKYSQLDLSGTARYVGMAGAFGALGGDISAMSTNPGGLAIYRSSEVVATLGLSVNDAKTTWTGIETKDSKTKFNFDNIAYVGYFPTANETGIMGWNVGFSYNRAKSFNRSYRMVGTNLPFSLSDYVAFMSNGIPVDKLRKGEEGGYDPYDPNNGVSWLSVLGFQGGLIEPKPGSDDRYERFTTGNVTNSSMYVNERGAIDKYNFSFATNISNIAFIGATLVVTDLSYHMNSSYGENFSTGDILNWDNTLKTEGTGYGFNLGAIFRPTDFLRLGVAYNSKTWYKMTDTSEGAASTLLKTGGKDDRLSEVTPQLMSDYEFSSPDRWIFSVAGIIGQTALVSVDYEISNYGNMKLSDAYGNALAADNADISRDYGIANTLRVGVEVKPMPQFAVRAGGAWSTTPAKQSFRSGATEVFTRGTTTNYSINENTTSYYTVGLGYRFTPNFYADLACVYRTYKENVYAFSNIYSTGEPTPQEPVNSYSIPAALKNSDTKVVLTLGYKF